MAIHGLEPMARARSAPARARQSSVCRLTSIRVRERRTQVLGSAIAPPRVRVCKLTECDPSPAGRWWRTRQALARKPHAPREAARVHSAAGVADAWALAACARVPARRPRGGCSHQSLAADRCARGHSPVRQFAGVASRGPHLGMLVGVSGSDVHDRQVGQVHPTTGVGRQRSSQSAAPMPAGILGRLWRVSLLGFPFKATVSAIGTRAGRVRRPAWAAEKRPPSRVAGIHAPSALRDAPHPGASRDRCERHR
jgi:hypothetical protein